MSVLRTSLVLAQPDGLHARPASQFVKLAASFGSTIRVRVDGKEANAKSILGVLTLGASKGCHVELEAEGEDAAPALEQLTQFLQAGGPQ